MRVTYLIGNGFDIKLGLKTSYIDFYKYLSNVGQNVLKNNIYKAILTDELQVNQSPGKVDWSDFEVAIGEYTNKIKNEIELEMFIKDYEEFIEDFTNFIESQVNFSELDSFYKSSIGTFNKAVLKPDNMEENDRTEIVKDYKKASTEKKIRDFIVFNYTETFDKIYEHWKYKFSQSNLTANTPIHIHGLCQSEVLLGVNDISQISADIAESETIKMMMIKTVANESSTTLRFNKAKDIMRDSDMFIIFGMAIGDSDKFWWETIVEHLENNKIKKVLIYAYEKDKKSLDKFIHKKAARRKEWQDKLVRHSKSSDKEQLYKQIIVQFNTDKIFNFDKITLNEQVTINN